MVQFLDPRVQHCTRNVQKTGQKQVRGPISWHRTDGWMRTHARMHGQTNTIFQTPLRNSPFRAINPCICHYHSYHKIFILHKKVFKTPCVADIWCSSTSYFVAFWHDVVLNKDDVQGVYLSLFRTISFWTKTIYISCLFVHGLCTYSLSLLTKNMSHI